MRILLILLVCALVSCQAPLPKIAPTLITENVPHDSDDAAIWINKANPENSIVFGTDKDEVNGGVYAFNLDGKILPEYSITGISYPNNVDVAYDFQMNDSIKKDLLVFTEREKNQIRIFSIPDMTPLDNGGFPVFEDADAIALRRPMGVSIYENPENNKFYAIVSRKEGPTEGYLYQYEILPSGKNVTLSLARKFGNFSGEKEIEAIAVDDELGYVYYSDEGVGIRKYYADPSMGDEELGLFGGEFFKDDIEGISIAYTSGTDGYLIVSDQGDNSFNIFKRNDNSFVKKLNLGTLETDGCEVTTEYLGPKFPKGLLVTMNDEQNFYFHSLDSLKLK